MESDHKLSIFDWVHMNSSVPKLAEELVLPLPILWKYMKAYDNGNVDEIPDNVVAYFDQRATSPEFFAAYVE